MSEKYNEYISEHNENVRKGFNWLKENLPEILPSDMLEMSVLENVNIYNHDQSKFSEEEYDAYDKYFYGRNKTFEVVENFNYAWLHHIHNNPHHWQYWVLINDDPDNGEIILDMPDVYIIEMICDWWSFSWKKGNLEEIFTWYAEHKDYMKISEYTRNKVEEILLKINAKLTNSKLADLNAKQYGG